jgi:hypothetical protein
MTTGEFAWRLAKQIDVGETMFLEFVVNGHWNAVDLRKWVTGTTALLEKEYTPSSAIVRTFMAESSELDVEYQLNWKETLEKCLEILCGVQQAVSPRGDGEL